MLLICISTSFLLQRNKLNSLAPLARGLNSTTTAIVKRNMEVAVVHSSVEAIEVDSVNSSESAAYLLGGVALIEGLDFLRD